MGGRVADVLTGASLDTEAVRCGLERIAGETDESLRARVLDRFGWDRPLAARVVPVLGLPIELRRPDVTGMSSEQIEAAKAAERERHPLRCVTVGDLGQVLKIEPLQEGAAEEIGAVLRRVAGEAEALVRAILLPADLDEIDMTIGFAAESEPTGHTCPACGAEERRQKIGPVTTTMLHRDDCPTERRRAREAQLAALVSNPPPWAQPDAWRAAVLAVSEECIRRKNGEPIDRIADVWTVNVAAGVQMFAQGKSNEPLHARGFPAWNAQDVAVDAYARALTPHKAPPPERKRVSRSLPCDAYDDD